MDEPQPQESELQLLPSQPDNLNGRVQQSPEPDHQLRKWPKSPRPLKNNARSALLPTVFDAVLACFPFAFVVLAILAIHLDGNEISNYGETIIQATRLGPTVFPIVFAAVVSSLMRSYGLWKAQNGAKLGHLEQLNGSTSFAGTLSSILALRQPSILSVLVLLLWALSPLGGQSALRMISHTSLNISGNASVAYMDNNNTSSGLDGASTLADNLGAINSLYLTTLLASEEARSSPQDAWGWPKIPNLRYLPPNQSTANGVNNWRSWDRNETLVYSSLIGLMLQKIPADLQTELSVPSSYLDLDCHLLASNVSGEGIYESMGGSSVAGRNATNTWTALLPSSFFLDTTYMFSRTFRNQANINLFYGTRDATEGFQTQRAALFNCTISTISMESWLVCQNASCAVTRVRQSGIDKQASAVTPWNNPNDKGPNSTPFWSLIQNLPLAIGPLDRFQASPTDNFIYGDPLFDNGSGRDWTTVTEADVSNRLTTVFNTYWQASLAPFRRSQASAAGKNLVDGSDTEAPPFISANSTTFRSLNVYRANSGWISIFLISAIVLQLCAITAVTLKFVTVAPDILGYVSSMTRDNPYVPVPDGGSTLSGIERARLLWDMEVQILNVDERKDTGHIAFVSRAFSGSEAASALNRRRAYA